MSKHKAKVKAHFTHKGQSYSPGDTFESDDEHEVKTLASAGHIEDPAEAQQGGQQQGQGQAGSSTGYAQAKSQDPTKDPSKGQGR